MTAHVTSGTPHTNNKLVVWLAVMAGLSYVASAGALADILPAKLAALFLALIGGLNTGTAAYVTAMKPVQTPVEVVKVEIPAE